MASRVLELVRRLPHIVGVSDATGRLLWVNDAARRFVGAERDHVLTTTDLFTTDVIERYQSEIRPALLEAGRWEGELPIRRADGTIGIVDAVLVGDTDGDQEVRWLAALAVDITEQREREATLSHRASHDPLTGLPNRALLLERMRVALTVAERTHSALAVLALDLDGFKPVNDTHGHAVGDRVLEQVTMRLRSTVRPADTVARLGGDEFVVVVHPPEDPASALTVAERIRDQLGTLDYMIDDHRFRITASIGLTIAAAGTPTTPAALLAAADRAMYRAKRAGGNRVRVTGAGRFGADDRVERIGRELGQALLDGRIVAAFDPVVDLATGQVAAVEALARLDHAERGRVPARSFLEEATLTGHADPIWWAASHHALRTAADIDLALPLEVNLSMSQLRAQDLGSRLRALRRLAPRTPLRIDVDAHSLLELTTGGMRVVEALAAEEIELVLSGHGAAGLPAAMLAHLPLAAVKLDPVLVRRVRREPKAIALATRLTSTLGVPCIAQVEDERDLPLLAVLGVTGVQGAVTGGEWDTERLAAEVAAGRAVPAPPDLATRPRP